MKSVSTQASNNVSASNKNVVKVNKFKGVLNGNIFPVSATTECDIRLDFSCSDNSQYIPAI